MGGRSCRMSGREANNVCAQFQVRRRVLGQVGSKLNQNWLKVVWKLSGSCLEVVSMLLQCCLKVVTRLAQNWPLIVSKLAQSCLKVFVIVVIDVVVVALDYNYIRWKSKRVPTLSDFTASLVCLLWTGI